MPGVTGSAPNPDTSEPARGNVEMVPPVSAPSLADARAAALHRTLFAQAPDAMLVADSDGRYVDANPAALRLLGYGRDELLRLRLEDVVTPDPSWDTESDARFTAAGSWQGEVELRTHAGVAVPAEARTHRVEMGDGEPGLTVTVFRDLSERKAHGATLARLAAMVRSSADAIIGETLSGIVTDWNPAAERLYGYPAGEVVGQPLINLIAPERLPEARDLLLRARAGESTEGFETVRYTREGRRIDVSLTVSPVRDEARQIVGTSAFVRDITDRKATETALAASEARFRTAFEDAAVGMALVGLDGEILEVNRACCAMLGYADHELLALTVQQISHPDDLERDFALAARAIAGEFRTYDLEKRYRRKDSATIWGHLGVSLVRDDQDAPAYLIAQLQEITARKEAEAELAATHQHARQILERITDGFCAIDLGWRFTYVNEAAETIFGRTREELLGAEVWQEFAPAIATPTYEACLQAMASGQASTIEVFYPPDDAWYEMRLYPSPEGLSVFFRDVTATRKLTQELRASETRYRTLVEHLPAVVYLLAADETQSRLYYSPYLEVLTGFTPDEMLHQAGEQHWLTFVHPDDRDRVAAADQFQIESGGLFRADYRMLRKAGDYVWVQDDCVPVHDDTGTIVAWQGVLTDISHQVAAEEAQSRLAAIVESAEVAIISRTLDGTITSWNQGAEQLYGLPAEVMLGQPIASLLSPDDPRDELVNAEELAEESKHFEATRYRPDGSAMETAISLSPIRDRNGAIVGVSSIAQDITARKLAEEELRAALEAAQAGIRSKSIFLSMMSHELRTPLQAVLGYADFLLTGPPGTLTAEQREDIGYIRQGAGRMVALIEQMLDLSRMEAGRLELASEPVDARDILELVRQDIAPQARDKALDFAIIVPDALPPILGDAGRVRQILLNLAGNAVKFTEQGSVQIEAAATRAGVQIAVRDTGIGISAEALPGIFEEFRQVDGNLTRRHGGAGLGLAISRRLAEQMGGQISVESVPNAGSTFTLHLPKSSGARGPAPR